MLRRCPCLNEGNAGNKSQDGRQCEEPVFRCQIHDMRLDSRNYGILKQTDMFWLADHG